MLVIVLILFEKEVWNAAIEEAVRLANYSSAGAIDADQIRRLKK